VTDVQDVHKWTAADCEIPEEVKAKVRALVLAKAKDSAEVLSMLGLEEQ
jgi:hypothetical protein